MKTRKAPGRGYTFWPADRLAELAHRVASASGWAEVAAAYPGMTKHAVRRRAAAAGIRSTFTPGRCAGSANG